MAPLTVQKDFEDKVELDKEVKAALLLMDQIDELTEKLDDHKDAVKRIFRRRSEQDGKISHETKLGVAKFIQQVVYDYPVDLCLTVVPQEMHDDLFPRKADKAAIRKLIDSDAPHGVELKDLAVESTQENLVLETAKQKLRKAQKAKERRLQKKAEAGAKAE